MRRSNTRRRMGTVALLFGLLVLTAGVIAGPAQAAPKEDPPGSNGTVKIHDVGDPTEHPDNDPHVTCPFEIDFYNFDANQHLNAVLDGHPPSGSGEVWTGDITTDNDPASGAGNDFDGSILVTNPDLSGLTPQQNQGFHLKLTVTDDEGHKLVKHKTFWVTGCGEQETTTTEQGTTTTTEQGTTTTTEEVTTTTEEVTTTTAGQGTTTTEEVTTTTEGPHIVAPTTTTTAEVLGNDLVATTTTATVLGEVIARTAPPAAAQLPRTGTSVIEWGVPFGIALILLGLVLLSYENVLNAAKS